MDRCHLSRDLDAEIAREQTKLAELDRLRADAAARLIELNRARADRMSGGLNEKGAYTPASKVRLFRDLFIGRDDVFAVRWENAARGTSGYAPRCANERRRGVCGKPKIRCGACTSQAFVALDDREVLAHLRGRQVIGIYPLLPNDTCRLLAIDLDRKSWQSDARAIQTTCRTVGLEPAIERSRSGNGAHLWFFFAHAVSAADARKLGLLLLTRTMASEAALGVASYDRLFPNQDVLPTGGFGNLIALPLQLAARKAGNTEFLDDDLHPHRNQWSYLASVPRISADLLQELVAHSDQEGELAVRSADHESRTPWRPPRPLRDRLREVSIPDAVAATLSDRLYLNRSGLPTALTHAVKRIATFSNPMFLERQRMRMSVARTPRVIGCFENSPATLLSHVAA